jgi:hypothetical protein
VKIPVMIVFWGVVECIAPHAKGETGARVSPVIVYVRPGSSDPAALRLPCAERLASAIFETAGVQIEWETGRRISHAANPAIVIEVVSNAPRSFHAGTLAYALPFEGEHIRIFWDRVMDASNDWIRTNLLAHVMVHEITHILQGTNYHSKEGIMKAHWTDKDLTLLRSEQLSFNGQDIDLIKRGCAMRSTRLNNAARLHDLLREEPVATDAVTPGTQSAALGHVTVAPKP